MQEIINIINLYGVDTVVLALIINILTGIIKIPIKRLSSKLQVRGIQINKYITLLPIVLGVAVSALATGLFLEPGVFWNERTPVLALTASSLSLSVYAICEKFFAGKRNTDNSAQEENSHTEETQELIRKIGEFIEGVKIGGGNVSTEEPVEGESEPTEEPVDPVPNIFKSPIILKRTEKKDESET